MKLIKSCFVLSILSVASLSFADIIITNKTDSYGTGKFNIGPCSSRDGDQGIIQPNSTLNVPSSIFKFCGSSGCQAHIFMSKNCTGKEVATVQVNQASGVLKLDNLDPKEFTMTGGGDSITVDKASGWQNFLNWLF